jgi:hypothetical protein
MHAFLPLLTRFLSSGPFVALAIVFFSSTSLLADRPSTSPETVGSGLSANRSSAVDRDLVQLRTRLSSPEITPRDRADLAISAIDAGRRLLVLGRAPESQSYFETAETALEMSLEALVEPTPTYKSMLLQKLAFIRHQYLGKSALAERSLAEAQKLDPSDTKLERLRGRLNAALSRETALKRGEGKNHE